MDYGKKGVRSKQKALNSKSVKWGRKIVLTFVKVFLIAIIGVGILGVSAGIGMFKGIIASSPNITLSALIPSHQASFIFDNKGNEIDRVIGTSSNRIIIDDMSKIPENLAHAFVAVEDERFYEHNGIDIKGLFRAGYQFLKTGGKEAQGASTITQQLLKNAIFTDWTSEGDNHIKKIKRKLQEQYLAIEVSKYFTKDEVLLQYMNTINLGQNTLGVEAAAQRYFGKSCSNLTLSECAVIASITQNPSRYNPIKHPEENQKRRETCLNKMLELHFINKSEYDEAMADTDNVYDRITVYNVDFLESNSTKGTYFSDAIQKQVLQDLIEVGGYNESIASNMLYSGGLRIYSTLDQDIQNIVDEEFSNEENYPSTVKWYLNYALTVTSESGEQTNYSKENMMEYFKKNIDKNFNLIFASKEAAEEAIETYKAAVMQEGDTVDENITLTPQPQASITIIDQHTGYVVALLGGRGAKEGRLTLNRATDTVRQPGSTFKVVAAYAPALDSAGLSLASVFQDAPFSYDNGRPVKNYYSGYKGIVPVRYAIEQSMNIVAVKTLTQITPQLGYDYLQNFGFTSLTNGVTINGKVYSDVQQPLALGGITFGVKNVELCAAYASIANGGGYIEPKLYTKVEDSEGNVILDNTSPQSRQVIKPTTAYLLTDAMVDVVTKGTGRSVNFGSMAIAGKTGTTTENNDVWFAGYTPYYTAATWAGYDNNVELNSKAGETNIAKKLWRSIMSRIHENLENKSFDIPSGLVRATVCSSSGKLPIPGVCGATITDYFAEGTVPTESCSVHYQGALCAYDHLPATDDCPFRIENQTLTLPLVEDPSLWSGSSSTVTLPDGSVAVQTPQTTTHCQHDATFFANPDYEGVISQQQYEMDMQAQQAAEEQQQPEEGEEGEEE